ncbi:MAG TPA: thymidylate kinase, partial [Thermoanaerobaculia bacterium]|nr:thymidylate kinase [Thermoanaerobaculia bacterium]
EGLARAKRRDAGAGRFEAAELAFHERVRAAFLALGRREPGRVAVVPVAGDASAVFERTWGILADRFGLS